MADGNDQKFVAYQDDKFLGLGIGTWAIVGVAIVGAVVVLPQITDLLRTTDELLDPTTFVDKNDSCHQVATQAADDWEIKATGLWKAKRRQKVYEDSYNNCARGIA